MEINHLAKANRATRSAFLGALILIIAFFVYGQVAEPHARYLFALYHYDTAMDDMLAKSKVVEGEIKLSKKKLENLASQFAKMRNTLYTQAEAEEFFSDLQGISVETECPIYSLTFVTDEPAPEVKQAEQTLGVTAKKAVFSVGGMYENVMTLLERLQARNRKVWIEGLNMEIVNDDAAQVKCDITIKIYTIQNKEAALYE